MKRTLFCIIILIAPLGACVEEAALQSAADAGPEVDADDPAAEQPKPLPCAERTSWPSGVSQHQWHRYDEQGRLAQTLLDFDGDGDVDEVVTYERSTDGSVERVVVDGGQGLPPDGVPDVVTARYYDEASEACQAPSVPGLEQ